jgi:hypothetical protein
MPYAPRAAENNAVNEIAATIEDWHSLCIYQVGVLSF